MGVKQTGDQVGVGTGEVWEGHRGDHRRIGRVNLANGKVRFYVKGLIFRSGVFLHWQSWRSDWNACSVTRVKGTLVCDVDGTANGGNSIDFDTPATLSTRRVKLILAAGS